ncbi:hypothetical protein QQF64_019447 [Cirrhinus molitorella]|uniref:Uncharacterized protein n=1 Tax=Cirrhinus molitorella TaxID=172907 RepID=A0ABR3LHY3_9TELE
MGSASAATDDAAAAVAAPDVLGEAVASSPPPYPISPSWLLLSRLVISISETLLALLSKRKGIMDLINWSLNAIDTIFSTRSLGSGEPNCPAGTFASGYVMDGVSADGNWWGPGVSTIGKSVSAAQNPAKLAGWIETVVGRAVSTQTVVMDRKMENIMEKLAALQRILDKPETSDGQ